MCVKTDNKSTVQAAGRRIIGSVTGLINRIGSFVSKSTTPETDRMREKAVSADNAYSFGKRNPLAGGAGAASSQTVPAAGPDGAAVLDGGTADAPFKRKPTAADSETADDTGVRIRYVLAGICFMGMGFLLGNAPAVMGANPFGTALLCAAGKYTGFIYAGLLGSALLSDHAVMQLCVYSLAIGLRILISASCAAPSERALSSVRRPSGSAMSRILDFALSPPPGILREPLTLRVCAGLSAALMSGLWRIIAGGFLIYDLLGTMFELAVAPAAVFLFAGAFDRTEHKNKVEHALRAVSDAPYRELGMLTLLAALVFSIKEITFYGFSAAAILAAGTVFFVANKGGVLRACVTGLVCGLVYSPELAPAFGLAGLTAGLLQGLGVLGMCAATCAVGGAYGVYVSGFEALRTLVPDLIGASGIYAAALRLGLLPKVVIFTSSIAPPDERAR